MKTYIALFRGINVGGRNILPMKELIAILEGLGAESVATYIQSGNAVFRHSSKDGAKLAEDIRSAISECRGFDPNVLLLDKARLEKAIEGNPFPEAESEPKTLHLFFLASAPGDPDLETLEELKGDNERFLLKDRVFYLHAPYGIGRSKLAARAEKSLGVPATARNWRTVRKVADMAEKCG